MKSVSGEYTKTVNQVMFQHRSVKKLHQRPNTVSEDWTESTVDGTKHCGKLIIVQKRKKTEIETKVDDNHEEEEEKT